MFIGFIVVFLLGCSLYLLLGQTYTTPIAFGFYFKGHHRVLTWLPHILFGNIKIFPSTATNWYQSERSQFHTRCCFNLARRMKFQYRLISVYRFRITIIIYIFLYINIYLYHLCKYEFINFYIYQHKI